MRQTGLLKIKVTMDDQPIFKETIDNPKKWKGLIKDLEEKFK